MQKSLYLAAVALGFVLLASNPLAAQAPTVTFNLTSVNASDVLGGVYTSPYFGNINGGSTIPVICDDFNDESYVPETWTSYVTSLSSIVAESTTNTTVKFQSGWNGTGSASTAPLGTTVYANPATQLTQTQTYEAAAILAVDILNSTGMAQEEYSYAMWELTEPTIACSYLPGGCADIPGTDQAAVQTYLQNAVSEATSGELNSILNGDRVTIYSYDPPPQNGGTGMMPNCYTTNPCASLPPQEFISVTAPEPPSPALLGLDLLGVAGLILFARRRVAGSLTQ